MQEARASTSAATRWVERKSLLRIALEVVLIGGGVFLGLAGEQWRENARNRELAEESLRRFRSEIAANRDSVAAVKDYHATTRHSVAAYLAADAKERQSLSVNVSGLRPARFEHTAWDLALVTEALTHIDPSLAFALSRLYGVQQDYMELTRGIVQAMYLRPPGGDEFFQSAVVYWGDLTLLEPKLLEMYDELTPQIEQALGE